MTAVYPGDFQAQPVIVYDPRPDQVADPGEVVWAWVPYEEDHRQGKTRPVLVIGQDDGWLLAVFLSATNHDRDAEQEASQGRYWVRIGRGSWDQQRRVSFARVDRVIRLAASDLSSRAERLERDRFEKVAAGIRQHWSD